MTDAAPPAPGSPAPSASVFSATRRLARFFARHPPAILLALAWVAAMLVLAFLGPLFAPQDFMAIDLRARLAPPVFMGGTWAHALGTDELGRDVLSRLIASIRISLTIAFVATLVAATVGVALGFLAAWARGRVEQAILMLVDAQAAMPFMIIALAVLAFLGNSLTLFTVLLGFYGWERIARIARGLAIAAQEQGYAAAARDLGASPWRVYFRHILPNIASTLIVSMTLNFPEVILLESGLSFLGLGLEAKDPSWGQLLNQARTGGTGFNWWIATFPGLAIFLTVFPYLIIVEALRDHVEPKLKKVV